MPERFPQIAFTDVLRARANLALIEPRLPARLWQALPTLLAQIPDPDGALNYLERYVRDDGRELLPRTLRYVERNPAALHYLLLVFSYSRFLSETLVQQPELAEWLHRPTRTRHFAGGIERIKSDEDLDEDFARFEATALDTEPARVLARFKRREYLRIMLRDVLGFATLADTTLEISRLADLLLRRALRTAEQRLHALYGTPQFADPAGRTQPASLVVLSLGKLGAQELNYASDVDLMFLYDHEGHTFGGTQGAITNGEFFIRLSHAVLKLVTEVTPEGAVFRVDVRLRPQGAEGFIALSVPAALDYYRTRGREWELQMLIKARPSAGNTATGRGFLREVHPLIFRPEFNLAAVETVLNAREEMSRTLARQRPGTPPEESQSAASGRALNVKLSPGGIRDIEFLAQCLQRLYGGADSWLAAPAAASTLVALQRLHDKGQLPGHDFHCLSSAYQFLRVVEHRLQLRDGLQRHTLPGRHATPPGALDRLARRCGLDFPPGQAGEILLARVRQHFAEVREIYERLILPHHAAREAPEPPSVQEKPGGGLVARIGRSHPALAEVVREALGHSSSFARRGLDRFLTAALLEPEVIQALESHPEWVAQAAALFARSDLAVEMLSRHVADIHLLRALQHPPVTPAGEMHALDQPLGGIRTVCRERSLLSLVHSALAHSAPFDVFAMQTQTAEWALAAALPAVGAASGMDEDYTVAPFAILALGRLGTREMDFGSDADLVFVTADELSPQQREPWRRLAEQYIQAVSSQTREGSIVPVDTRLRPQGGAGDIVVSVAALCDYLGSGAQAWEAITWLKARPVAGNLTLGQGAVDRAREVLRRRWATADGRRRMRQDLSALRMRMEREGTGLKARGEFKHLPGSFYDIEYVLGLLAFLPEVAGKGPLGGNVLQQIAGLHAAGALDAAAEQVLRAAAELFRCTDHAHRVVTGASANRPPEPALAQRMAHLLHAWGILPEASAPLLEECLRAARAQVRPMYEKAFAPAGPAALQ